MAVILLHGFTHTGASWEPVMQALGESYRAIAPDLRGHGSAAHVRPVSLDAVQGDLERIAPPRFTLAGYSMGGRVALHLALAMAERIECLILIGASPGIADPVARAERQRADEVLAARIAHMRIEEFAEHWAATTPVLAGLSASAAARAREDRLRNTPDGLAAALRGLGTGVLPSVWDRLPELGTPVRLVIGERDQKFVAIASAMADRLPHATVHVVPGVGHAVHLEAPDVIAAVIGE